MLRALLLLTLVSTSTAFAQTAEPTGATARAIHNFSDWISFADQDQERWDALSPNVLEKINARARLNTVPTDAKDRLKRAGQLGADFGLALGTGKMNARARAELALSTMADLTVMLMDPVKKSSWQRGSAIIGVSLIALAGGAHGLDHDALAVIFGLGGSGLIFANTLTMKQAPDEVPRMTERDQMALVNRFWRVAEQNYVENGGRVPDGLSFVSHANSLIEADAVTFADVCEEWLTSEQK